MLKKASSPLILVAGTAPLILNLFLAWFWSVAWLPLLSTVPSTAQHPIHLRLLAKGAQPLRAHTHTHIHAHLFWYVPHACEHAS